jgi:fatty-acyl-CoA synthase
MRCSATVPTILNELLRADVQLPIDMSSFRTIVCGGSSVAEHLIWASSDNLRLLAV